MTKCKCTSNVGVVRWESLNVADSGRTTMGPSWSKGVPSSTILRHILRSWLDVVSFFFMFCCPLHLLSLTFSDGSVESENPLILFLLCDKFYSKVQIIKTWQDVKTRCQTKDVQHIQKYNQNKNFFYVFSFQLIVSFMNIASAMWEFRTSTCITDNGDCFSGDNVQSWSQLRVMPYGSNKMFLKKICNKSRLEMN